MKKPQPPISYRPTQEIREAVGRLTALQDRSINWMLNDLVTRGLASLEAAKEIAPVAVNN